MLYHKNHCVCIACSVVADLVCVSGTHEAVHQLIAPFRAFYTVAPTVVYDLGKFVADNTIKPVVEAMITMQISA